LYTGKKMEPTMLMLFAVVGRHFALRLVRRGIALPDVR